MLSSSQMSLDRFVECLLGVFCANLALEVSACVTVIGRRG